jgi:hypothetical protein
MTRALAVALAGLATAACLAGIGSAQSLPVIPHRPPAARSTMPSPNPANPTKPPAPLPAPPGVCRIFSVMVPERHVHSFDHVSATVKTTKDVFSVAVSVGHLPPQHLANVAPGLFAGATKLPWIPFFLHHTYLVTFTAYDGRGHSASRAVPVSVDW